MHINGIMVLENISLNEGMLLKQTCKKCERVLCVMCFQIWASDKQLRTWKSASRLYNSSTETRTNIRLNTGTLLHRSSCLQSQKIKFESPVAVRTEMIIPVSFIQRSSPSLYTFSTHDRFFNKIQVCVVVNTYSR